METEQVTTVEAGHGTSEYVARIEESGLNGHIPQPAVQYNDFENTDVGNSNRLVARFGHVLRWVPKWRTWLYYDGIRWAEYSEDEVTGLGKTVLYEMRQEANNLIANKETKDSGLLLMAWAIRSEQNSHLSYMVADAKPDLIAKPSDFDRNPDLLNMPDGTFDFTVGELREHRPGDMITKVTNAPYGDGTDDYRLFAQVMDEITDGNIGLSVYIQQVLGLSLTGDRTVKHVWFPHGGGDNGKTLLFEVTGEVMGEYADVGQNTDIIDHGRYNTSKSFGLAGLVGKRRAVYAELKKEDRLNWSILKIISGADTTKVEEKFKRAVSAQLECKIFIYCNELPTIEQVTEAEWGHIRVIPFPRCWNKDREECNDPDPYLRNKLLQHKSAILRWMIQGEMLRRDFGLLEPAVVTDATNTYRQDSDILNDFLKECTYRSPGDKIRSRKLYTAFEHWFKEPGDYTPLPINESDFGKSIRAHGYTVKTSKGRATVVGIAIKPDYDPDYQRALREEHRATMTNDDDEPDPTPPHASKLPPPVYGEWHKTHSEEARAAVDEWERTHQKPTPDDVE
jgi:putative DNA primase/helicase